MNIRNRRGGISSLVILIVVILAVAILGGLVLASSASVGVGEGSVIVNTWTGDVRAGPTGPLNKPGILSPGFESLVTIYTAVSSVHMCSGFDDNIVATSNLDSGCQVGSPLVTTKDGLRLAVDLNVIWTLNPDPQGLVNLYKHYPQLNYADNTIIPTIKEVVRQTIQNYTFLQVFTEQQILPPIIAHQVVDRVTSNPTLSGIVQITTDGVQVLNIHMPESVQQALQAQKNSQIAILTAQNNRNATIVNADAQRLSAILSAQGAAQAKIISANATKTSIETVLQSFGCPKTDPKCQEQAATLYLTLLQLQQIAASNPNVIFIIGQGSNGQPFIFQLPSTSSTTTTTTTTTTGTK